MTISGTIKKVFPIQTFDSGFQLRECVLTTEDKYPQDILVRFFKDKISLLDNHKEGSSVEISINLRGKSFQDKNGNERYITEVAGWKIDKLNTSASDQMPDRNPQEQDDDLPF